MERQFELVGTLKKFAGRVLFSTAITLASSSCYDNILLEEKCINSNIQTNKDYGKNTKIGFSFSNQNAEALGLEPRKTYETLLSMGFDYVRIGTYMNRPTNVMLREISQQIRLAKKYKTEVILVVGEKAPFFPEYHRPNTAQLEKKWEETALINAHKALVKFANDPQVSMIQISNEPFHNFQNSNVPSQKEDFIKKLQVIAKAVTNKPLIITDFAEIDAENKSSWQKTLQYADIGGLGIYKQMYYRTRPCQELVNTLNFLAQDAQKLGKKIIISELQTYPWAPGTFSTDMLHKLYSLAKYKIGTDTILFWEVSKALKDAQNEDSARLDALKEILASR